MQRERCFAVHKIPAALLYGSEQERDHYDMLNEFHWISEGKIKWKETIVEGLENAPKEFIGLFKGESFG